MSPARSTPSRGTPSRPDTPPQRTCVACRRTRDKQDLIRLARHGDTVIVDWDQVAAGRGSSICPDLDCVEQATARDAARLRASLRGGTVKQVLSALTDIRNHLESAQHAKEHNA